MRWLVWSPQLLAGCVLVVTVVSANLPYPLLEGDDARFAGAYGVGVAVWYSVFLGLTSLIALLVAHTALQPLTTRAAIAAALTGLLVAGTATRSSSGFISIRGDGVIVAGPGVLAVLGAGRLRFRSEAARDARRGDPASWGRWGSGSRRVVAAWFGPGERFLVAVTDAVPDRPRYGAAVALTKDGELDRAFSRNVGGDLGGWPVVAGGRIVVARSAPLGVRVLRADGHEDAAATAALASALSGVGATELDVHAIDAAGDVVLAKLGDGRLAAIDVSRDPPSIRASGAPPAGLERHVAMGGRLVSARVGGDDAPSLASLERERIATSDGTSLALRLPPASSRTFRPRARR